MVDSPSRRCAHVGVNDGEREEEEQQEREEEEEELFDLRKSFMEASLESCDSIRTWSFRSSSQSSCSNRKSLWGSDASSRNSQEDSPFLIRVTDGNREEDNTSARKKPVLPQETPPLAVGTAAAISAGPSFFSIRFRVREEWLRTVRFRVSKRLLSFHECKQGIAQVADSLVVKADASSNNPCMPCRLPPPPPSSSSSSSSTSCRRQRHHHHNHHHDCSASYSNGERRDELTRRHEEVKSAIAHCKQSVATAL